jgi:hypothetical protein
MQGQLSYRVPHQDTAIVLVFQPFKLPPCLLPLSSFNVIFNSHYGFPLNYLFPFLFIFYCKQKPSMSPSYHVYIYFHFLHHFLAMFRYSPRNTSLLAMTHPPPSLLSHHDRAFAVSAPEAFARVWSCTIRFTLSCCDVGYSWTYLSCLAGSLMQDLNRSIRVNGEAWWISSSCEFHNFSFSAIENMIHISICYVVTIGLQRFMFQLKCNSPVRLILSYFGLLFTPADRKDVSTRILLQVEDGWQEWFLHEDSSKFSHVHYLNFSFLVKKAYQATSLCIFMPLMFTLICKFLQLFRPKKSKLLNIGCVYNADHYVIGQKLWNRRTICYMI